MIPDLPSDLLALLKSNAPDPTKPVSILRQNFSEFMEGMWENEFEPPEIEPVEINKSLRGYWIGEPDTATDQVVLFFHGGSFNFGSTRDHLELCSRIARTAQTRIFSVDYRLAPEYVFPAPVEDAVSSYKYLLSRGYQAHRIIPAGISAGGTLVLDLLLSARDQGLPLPSAGVCMSPFADMLFNGESVTKNRENDWLTPAMLAAIRTGYLAGRDPLDPLASPVYGRLHGLPRLYVQAGTHELLLSDAASFVDKARWAGVPVQFEIWEGMFHCWQLFSRQIPEGERATELAGTFIHEAIVR